MSTSVHHTISKSRRKQEVQVCGGHCEEGEVKHSQTTDRGTRAFVVNEQVIHWGGRGHGG